MRLCLQRRMNTDLVQDMHQRHGASAGQKLTMLCPLTGDVPAGMKLPDKYVRDAAGKQVFLHSYVLWTAV